MSVREAPFRDVFFFLRGRVDTVGGRQMSVMKVWGTILEHEAADFAW